MKKIILSLCILFSFVIANDKYVPLQADEMIDFKFPPQPPKKTEVIQNVKQATKQPKQIQKQELTLEQKKSLVVKGVGKTVF